MAKLSNSKYRYIDTNIPKSLSDFHYIFNSKLISDKHLLVVFFISFRIASIALAVYYIIYRSQGRSDFDLVTLENSLSWFSLTAGMVGCRNAYPLYITITSHGKVVLAHSIHPTKFWRQALIYLIQNINIIYCT